MREFLKLTVHLLATLCITPMLLTMRLRALAIGRDRALQGATQALSRVPGLSGQYLRRAFLAHALSRCARSATVEFGVTFSHAGARLGERVYVGPGSSLGFVDLEEDVLVGPDVQVLSGAHTHGTADASSPIRDQPQTRTCVRIGRGAWIGAGAIVMADVGANSVIGAGAVVNKAIPDDVVAAGVPAVVIKRRAPG